MHIYQCLYFAQQSIDRSARVEEILAVWAHHTYWRFGRTTRMLIIFIVLLLSLPLFATMCYGVGQPLQLLLVADVVSGVILLSSIDYPIFVRL